MDTTTFIGLFGATLVLVAFIGNETGRLHAKSLLYDHLNIIGSGVLMYYSAAVESWPFIILNGVWFAFSAKDIIKKFL